MLTPPNITETRRNDNLVKKLRHTEIAQHAAVTGDHGTYHRQP